MSVVVRGRVLRRGAFTVAPASPSPLSFPATEQDAPGTGRMPRARRVPKAHVDGVLDGARAIEDARTQAIAIVAAARAEAAAVTAKAAEEARASEHAKVSALYLAMAAARERRAQEDLDRTVALAVLLAERLLGASLELHPEQIASLARQALAEARGARRAVIEVHPLDAAALERQVEDVVASGLVVEVRAAPELTRGSMRVHTNLGTLDAQLTPQLQRLAEALRDALGA